MEKYVYAFRDEKLGAFNDPQYDVMDKEHKKDIIARSCLQCPEEQRARVADTTLYFLGTFDDVKGTFNLLVYPELLLNLRDYIKFDVPKQEVVSDGTKEC